MNQEQDEYVMMARKNKPSPATAPTNIRSSNYRKTEEDKTEEDEYLMMARKGKVASTTGDATGPVVEEEKIYVRPTNTMNTRAPTNLNPYSNLNATKSILDDSIPMDEAAIPSSISVVSRLSSASSQEKVDNDLISVISGVGGGGANKSGGGKSVTGSIRREVILNDLNDVCASPIPAARINNVSETISRNRSERGKNQPDDDLMKAGVKGSSTSNSASQSSLRRSSINKEKPWLKSTSSSSSLGAGTGNSPVNVPLVTEDIEEDKDEDIDIIGVKASRSNNVFASSSTNKIQENDILNDEDVSFAPALTSTDLNDDDEDLTQSSPTDNNPEIIHDRIRTDQSSVNRPTSSQQQTAAMPPSPFSKRVQPQLGVPSMQHVQQQNHNNPYQYQNQNQYQKQNQNLYQNQNQNQNQYPPANNNQNQYPPTNKNQNQLIPLTNNNRNNQNMNDSNLNQNPLGLPPFPTQPHMMPPRPSTPPIQQQYPQSQESQIQTSMPSPLRDLSDRWSQSTKETLAFNQESQEAQLKGVALEAEKVAHKKYQEEEILEQLELQKQMKRMQERQQELAVKMRKEGGESRVGTASRGSGLSRSGSRGASYIGTPSLSSSQRSHDNTSAASSPSRANVLGTALGRVRDSVRKTFGDSSNAGGSVGEGSTGMGFEPIHSSSIGGYPGEQPQKIREGGLGNSGGNRPTSTLTIPSDNRSQNVEKTISPHDKVRKEALMMLQMAGRDGDEDVASGLEAEYEANGGLRSVGRATVKRDDRFSIDDDGGNGSLVNDGSLKHYNTRTSTNNKFMDEITIEEQGVDSDLFQDDGTPQKKKPNGFTKLFDSSSRYSVDRHVMAVNGGMTSSQVVDKIDRDRERSMSGRNSNKYGGPISDDGDINPPPLRREGQTWSNWGPLLNPIEKVSGWIDDYREKSVTYSRAEQMEIEEESHLTMGTHRSKSHSLRSTGEGRSVFTGSGIFATSPTNSKRSRGVFNILPNSEGDGDSSVSTKKSRFDEIKLFMGGNGGGGSENLPRIPMTSKYDQENDDYAVLLRRKKLIVAGVFLVILAIVSIITLAVTRHSPSTISKTKNSGSNVNLDENSGSNVNLDEHLDDIISNTEVTFTLITATPSTVNKGKKKLREQLANLDSKQTSFLVHLGDVIGDAEICDGYRYKDASNILEQSPVPVFVVPGYDDWIRHYRANHCLNNWIYYFENFEQNFDLSGDLSSFDRNDESFRFLYNDVLFLGLKIIDSYDTRDHNKKVEDPSRENVSWVEQSLSIFKQQYRAVVLFANAIPLSKNKNDFIGIITALEKETENKPILYAHGTYGEYNSIGDNSNTIPKTYIPYSAHPTFSAVKVRDGTIAEPLQVTVRSGDSPFEFKGGTKL